MNQSFVYCPAYFFLNSLVITYVFLFIAAYLSYQPTLQYLLFPLILGGMSAPSISAFIMFAQSKDKNLWNDFCQKISLSRIKIAFVPMIIMFMPCLILLAIVISLLFGCSSNQLLLSQAIPDKALEGVNFLAILMIVIITCSLEEIGWRGYGIDSLNSMFNLWQTSLLFAALWSLWHLPAFFIKNGYFQQELWNLGIIHVVTYFVSLFPITILINWVYIKNNRSVLIAILSHAVLNLAYGLIKIQPATKIILMLLLLMVAGIVVIKDKKMFFGTAQ